MSAITAVTAQNSIGVQDITPLSGDSVSKQIQSCIHDISVDAIKIGMLQDCEIISAVASALEDANTNANIAVVLDPVMIATSGAKLIADDGVQALREKLFPLATLITPNLPELAHLTGEKIETSAQMIEAAEKLSKSSGCAVLAKGGHAEGQRIKDILIQRDARGVQFDHARINTPHTHGTGCTLSAAIATLLGHGQSLEHSVRLGRNFVRQAIEAAPGFGVGNGPLGHYAVRSLD